MGKGTIIENLGGGDYSVKMIYDGRAVVAAKIVNLNARIAALQIEFDAMPETTVDEIWAKRIVGLRITALEKSVDYYTNKFPADPMIYTSCIDTTADLTGDVGLLEVPGEYETATKINIVAGYNGQAVFNKAVHGQLMPPVAMGPWSTFLDKCMLPGWQKWKPLYRYGKIIADSIDFDNNTCDVCLDPEHSSQLNLAVNQQTGFTDCNQTVWPQFTDFCTRNPTHPTCTNTEPGTPTFISDAQLETIRAINLQVNSQHEYQYDQSGYRSGDSWDIMTAGQTGDCEDFALTKMQALLDAGYPVKNLQLAIVAVEGTTVANHAILIIQTTNRGTLVLDNRSDQVREASSLPYRFLDYQRSGQDWQSISTKLTAVAIEYENCDALAFADGDEIVVKFETQDFTAPKVVGFRENPAQCKIDGYYFCTRYNHYVLSVDTDTWVFSVKAAWPSGNSPYRAAGAVLNRNVFISGGVNTSDWLKSDLSTLFNTGNNTFTTKQPMPIAREGLAAGGFGTSAIFAGGLNIYTDWWEGWDLSNSGVYADSCARIHAIYCRTWTRSEYSQTMEPYNETQEYFLATDSWENRQNMPNARGMAEGFVIGDSLYIAGGADGKTSREVRCVCCYRIYVGPVIVQLGADTEHYYEFATLSSFVNAYNKTTQVWHNRQGLTAERASHAPAALDGKGYVFMGSTYNSITFDDYRLGFDLRESGVPASPVVGMGYVGECWWDVGSAAYSIYNTMSALKYDPIGDSWSALQSLPNNGAQDGTRDFSGTGLTQSHDSLGAIATLDSILVASVITYSPDPDTSPFFEYNPATDAYTSRGSGSQLTTVNGSRYMGDLGFGL